MNIVLTSDNNYLTYLGVTICSICENNRGEELAFHVILSGEVAEAGKEFLCEITGRYGAALQFYAIDENLLCNLPVFETGQPGHISKAAYYRLFLASILQENIDKVLYLDCDLVVTKPLGSLWDTDIEGCPLAAVPDMTEHDLIHYSKLRYSPKLGYFNSGVMLVNLKYWRENDCQKQFENFVSEHLDRIVYHDQDVLNYVFRETKMLLPIKYNVQEGALYERVNISWEYDEQLEEALRGPVIIHYTTGQKPWNKGCKHPWKDEWYKYLEKAGVKDFKPVEKKGPRKSAMQIARQALVRLGLLEPLYKYRNGIGIK